VTEAALMNFVPSC